MAAAVPSPVRLFHITAIGNLPAIAAAGALACKNAGKPYVNIAHQGAQGARSAKRVPFPHGATVHDFVPFYFAPRSPMLFTIDRGNVVGCSLKQRDIVHIETTVDLAVAGGAPFVIYDRNATLTYATAYTSLADLDKVSWDLLLEPPCLDGYCKYFHDVHASARYTDRRERRMAEFLVHGSLPVSSMLRIGVIDEAAAHQARSMLLTQGVPLPVEVKPDWYFLGQ